MDGQTTAYHKNESEIQIEKTWIEAARKDPRCFEPLYNSYHEQIFRFVFHRVQELSYAQDITSQVFMKAILNIKRYEFKGLPFSSWLYRIALNEVNQWYRDQKKQRTVDIQEARIAEEFPDFGAENTDYPRKALVLALNELDDKSLTLIEMRYFEQRSVKEVAEILSISESNAKVRCHRALNKLKELYSNKITRYENA